MNLCYVYQIPSLNQGFWYHCAEEYSLGDLVIAPFRDTFAYGIIFEVLKKNEERYLQVEKTLSGVRMKELKRLLEKEILSPGFINFLKASSDYNCCDFNNILSLVFPSEFKKLIVETLKKEIKDDKQTLKEQIKEEAKNQRKLKKISKEEGRVSLSSETISRGTFNDTFDTTSERVSDNLFEALWKDSFSLGLDIKTQKIKSKAEIFTSQVLERETSQGREGFFQNLRKWDLDSVSLKDKTTFKEIYLNEEQSLVYEDIKSKLDGYSVSVINGITGSGKTSIFLKTAQDVLKQGKKVLILVPEIALSKHIAKASEKFLGSEPFLWNSNVKPKKKKEFLANILSGAENQDCRGKTEPERAQEEHQDECQRSEKTCFQRGGVYLGTRSALFLPYKDLGLIIVDEEHDSSYKQNESPVYQARDMAVLRASKEGVPVILSSATPSVETKVNILSGKYREYLLTKRFHQTELPSILIEKYSPFKEKYIKDSLMEDVLKNYHSGGQTLIFLNRRGFSRSVYCVACKKNPECESCDNILSYHSKKNILKCHYCGHTENFDNRCLSCGSVEIEPSGGPGVEKINGFILDFFQKERIDIKTQIVSSDTAKDDNIDDILQRINQKETNIIIGTEIMSKGYHFPGLNLVIVLDYNNIVNEESDIRGNEKIFQLMMQVSGRAGRESEGKMIIQARERTRVLEFIQNYDTDNFYNHEIENRKKFRLPPFTKFIAVIVYHKDKVKALEEAKGFSELFVKKIETMLKKYNIPPSDIKILGPSESDMHLLKNNYRYRLLVKVNQMSVLSRVKKILKEISKNKESFVKVDVDPYNFI